MVAVLLEAGASLELRNAEGATPLVAAMHSGQEGVRAILEKAGAHPVFELHWAAENGRIEDLKALALKFKDVNVQDHKGYTALYAAAKAGHVDAVRLLLGAQADIDLPCNKVKGVIITSLYCLLTFFYLQVM